MRLSPTQTPLGRLSPLTPRVPGQGVPPCVPPPSERDEVQLSGTARLGAGVLLGLTVAGVAAGLTGCSAPPPQALVQVQGPPSQTYISTASEVELGKQVAEAVEKEMPIWHNPQAQQRLEAMGQRLVQTTTRHDIEYQFKLLDSDTVNAMAIPGGTIYATRGLMEKFPDDDQLAFVVGHEFAHLEQRHSMQKLTQVLLRKGITLPLAFRQWPIARAAMQAGDELINNRYSQAAESEADRIGQQHLVKMGIDPLKAVEAMQRLDSLHADQRLPIKIEQIFSDHPPTQERIKNLQQWAIGSGQR